MNIQLIQGQFTAKDAIDIITQMIHIKVKYQESKISNACNEEDIKMREARIKLLQKGLYEARNYIEQQGGKVLVQSDIQLSIK